MVTFLKRLGIHRKPGPGNTGRYERCATTSFSVVCYSFGGKMSDDARSVLAALTDALGPDRPRLEDVEDNSKGDIFVMSVVLAMVKREERHCVPFYVENAVPRYLEFEFRRLFRLSRQTVAALVPEFEASDFYPEGL